MQFVYRSHYEGPLSRRVRTLPDETVLGWFRRGWTVEDPRAWVGSSPTDDRSLHDSLCPDMSGPGSTSRPGRQPRA